MFRSAYLSGLLMSHGTDSVRTSRACGKRNNEALRDTGIKGKKEEYKEEKCIVRAGF